MKNLIKYISILIICLCLMFVILPNHSYAFGWGDIESAAETFTNTGGEVTYINKNDLGTLVNGLVNILTTIGTVASLGVLLILGIKYMFAQPNEAAKLKPKMIGAIVSAIVIVGAFGIWNLLGAFFSGIGGEVKTNTSDFNQSGTIYATITPGPTAHTHSNDPNAPIPTTDSGRSSNSGANNNTQTTSLTISENEITLNNTTNTQAQVHYTVEPSGKRVRFSSNDTNVATVSEDGVITAAGSGTTKIIATTDDNISAEVSVTVEPVNLGGTYTSKYTVYAEEPHDTRYNGAVLDYWAYIPDVSLVKTYDKVPLIIFLHGSGEGGSINAVMKTSLPGYINGYDYYSANESVRVTPAAVVVAPRFEKAYTKGWVMPAVEVYSTVKHIIAEVKEKGITIDENRISITGFSLGGGAAVDTINRYPDMFSSAVLVSPAQAPGNIAAATCPIRVYYEADEHKRYQPAWINAFGSGQNPNISLEISTTLRTHNKITRVYYLTDSVQWMVDSVRT